MQNSISIRDQRLQICNLLAGKETFLRLLPTNHYPLQICLATNERSPKVISKNKVFVETLA